MEIHLGGVLELAHFFRQCFSLFWMLAANSPLLFARFGHFLQNNLQLFKPVKCFLLYIVFCQVHTGLIIALISLSLVEEKVEEKDEKNDWYLTFLQIFLS